MSQQRQRLGGGESHLEILPGGVLESHGQEVGSALGQGHGEDGSLSLLGIGALFVDKHKQRQDRQMNVPEEQWPGALVYFWSGRS